MPKKSLSKLFIAATRKAAKNPGVGRPPPELATPRKPVPRSVPSSSSRPKSSGDSAAKPTTDSPRVSSQVLSQLKQAAARNAGASLSPEDGTVIDSSDFVKWHNGGGLVHRSACIDPTVLVEIGAIVHPNSVLGVDVHIGSGAIVGPSVSIGQSTKVGYNATLCNCSVGLSCIIYNGVCIGQDGFGFFVDEEGRILKKPQVLQVWIGNHVEIGANTCIDRGSWRETVIGDHTKIDNLVQIGHNVVIGKCCMLCGQVGVAGSVTMGDYVTLAGRVAVRDHVSIASKVRLAANSCVTKDIVEPGDYGGFPAVPIHEWRRQSANLRILSKKPIS